MKTIFMFTLIFTMLFISFSNNAFAKSYRIKNSSIKNNIYFVKLILKNKYNLPIIALNTKKFSTFSQVKKVLQKFGKYTIISSNIITTLNNINCINSNVKETSYISSSSGTLLSNLKHYTTGVNILFTPKIINKSKIFENFKLYYTYFKRFVNRKYNNISIKRPLLGIVKLTSDSFLNTNYFTLISSVGNNGIYYIIFVKPILN